MAAQARTSSPTASRRVAGGRAWCQSAASAAGQPIPLFAQRQQGRCGDAPSWAVQIGLESRTVSRLSRFGPSCLSSPLGLFLLAIAVARGLDALRLARHLRVVGSAVRCRPRARGNDRPPSRRRRARCRRVSACRASGQHFARSRHVVQRLEHEDEVERPLVCQRHCVAALESERHSRARLPVRGRPALTRHRCRTRSPPRRGRRGPSPSLTSRRRSRRRRRALERIGGRRGCQARTESMSSRDPRQNAGRLIPA